MSKQHGNQSEATARSEEEILPRLLQLLTASVSNRPWLTLGIVGLITALSLGIAARFLTFKTSRSDLISPNSVFQQRWQHFVDRFGDDSEVVVVIEGQQRDAIIPAMQKLGTELEQEESLFDRVLYHVDPSSLERKALQYLSPQALEAAQHRLEMYAPILEGHWNRAGLESYCERLAHFLADPSSASSDSAAVADSATTPDETAAVVHQAAKLGSSLETFLTQPGTFESPWPEIVAPSDFQSDANFTDRYQVTPNGHMGFIRLLPRVVSTDFSGTSASLKRLRELIEQAQTEFPNLKIGMTGIPVLEADEMRRSQSDMMLASLISFVGVGLILLIGFRGLRHPFLAMVMLGVGIAWCLGYATLSVGHLNILSVSFAAILIGLGIDFAIHYMARYLDDRHHGMELTEALCQTSRSVGAGIVTAAVTTALAFFCATLTDFLGVAELGIIAGGGILICAAATFIVLPPMISLADKNVEPRRLPTPFQGNLVRKLTSKYPATVTALTLLIILGIGAQALTFHGGRLRSRVKYDANLLNLQAKGLESVNLQRRIFKETNSSLLYAVSMTSSAQKARLLKEKYLAQPEVSRVEDLASYLPPYPPEETNLLVQAIHARLGRISDLPREFPYVNPQSIGAALEKLYLALRDRTEPEAVQGAAALDRFLNHLEAQPLDQQLPILTGYQQAMLLALQRQFQMLAERSNPEPVGPDDFPESLRARFVSGQGDWLLRVYPTRQIWDEPPLREFVAAVRSVDPEVTGTPLQNYEAANQIRRSYLNAALYALAVITIVLLIDSLPLWPMVLALAAPLLVVGFSMLLSKNSQQPFQPVWLVSVYVVVATLVGAVFDFQSVRNMFLTLLPPVAGLMLMFGILALVGIDLNPANLIVLPLILGIGVDDGVHVVHDFRHQQGRRYETGASTINAITLTSLTSMIGFGSMVVAAHQGLVSLGLVLVIGVGSCLFVSLVVLPAILSWISRRSDSEDSASSDSNAATEPRIMKLVSHSSIDNVA